ncbi:MAG: hypothetical protein NC087_07490 [Anaeroplasma bactoclasticum]|nr:hypothetical protein [Anaeroplasma bactoclasticum]MCM1557362.1 hypothetical protein [Anaeroplasma bactoclasticum]
MKKIVAVILCFIVIILCGMVDCYADESYETFNEIMMVDGKLLRYFTEDEMKEYMKYVKKTTFWGINVYTINQNVEATYISSTLYNVENRGETDVSYELDVVVDVSNKTSWSVSGNLSGTAKGSIKSFKTDLAAKAGVDYSNTTTESRKETQKLKVTVEKGSRAIVYLMGSARITNGVCACYICFVNVASCGFEYFTLVNQYPRMEKRKL